MWTCTRKTKKKVNLIIWKQNEKKLRDKEWVKGDNTATMFKLELRIINYIYVHVYNFKNCKLILKLEKKRNKKQNKKKRNLIKTSPPKKYSYPFCNHFELF